MTSKLKLRSFIAGNFYFNTTTYIVFLHLACTTLSQSLLTLKILTYHTNHVGKKLSKFIIFFNIIMKAKKIILPKLLIIFILLVILLCRISTSTGYSILCAKSKLHQYRVCFYFIDLIDLHLRYVTTHSTQLIRYFTK